PQHFITLNEMWKRMDAIGRAPYIEAIRGRPLTARNRHIQENLKQLRDDEEITEYTFSVASGQGLPPASVTIVAGAGQINVNALLPGTPPIGYSFYMRYAGALLYGDPTDAIIRPMHTIESAHESSNLVIDGLTAGTYVCGCWIGWERDSDGRIHYGTQLTGRTINVT
ncbi:unnamed protein product, partial [marine sediment metagenome]